MLQLALADIVHTLAKTTRKPHMVIECSSVGFIHMMNQSALTPETRSSLARAGWALLSFTSFVEAALLYHDIDTALKALSAPAGDVQLLLVQDNGMIRTNVINA